MAKKQTPWFDDKDDGWSDGRFSDDTLDTGFSSYKPVKGGTYKRCYESHPPLSLGNGLQIFGGSCHTPLVKDAEIYVGLDGGMKRTTRGYPWNPGEEVLFAIQDRGVPADPQEFVKLIEWLAAQLTAGRKCHVGCIGGHGRTGLVLASLACVLAGEKDAIAYVRQHYCKKAVESDAQVKFLGKLFGITTADVLKESYAAPVATKQLLSWEPLSGGAKSAAKSGKANRLAFKTFACVRSEYCAWGPKAVSTDK